MIRLCPLETRDDGWAYCPVCDPAGLRPTLPGVKRPCRAARPLGTAIHNTLARVGIRPRGGCRCEELAHTIDALGSIWLRDQVDEVADYMAAEARQRGLWVPQAGVRYALHAVASHHVPSEMIAELEAARQLCARRPQADVLWLIIGTHCSYSSLLAQMLERLSVWLGWPTDGGEDYLLARMCEAVYPFPRIHRAGGWTAERVADAVDAWCDQHLRRGAGRVVAAKYPTIAILLPHIREVLGDRLRVIWIRRDLQEAITSLTDRSRTPGHPRATAGQCETIQQAIWDACQAVRADHVVDAVRLLTDPIGTLRELASVMGIEADDDQLAWASAVLDPQRVRHAAVSPQIVEATVDVDTRDVTLCIPTINRRGTLEETVLCWRRRYPWLQIVIADQSDSPLPPTWRDCRVVPTGYDAGLSAARNVAVEAAQTRYVLIVDDDCPPDGSCDLERAVWLLEAERLDVVGGRRAGCHWSRPLRPVLYQDGIHLYALSRNPRRETNGISWQPTSTTLNVLVARRETLLQHPWDPVVRIGREHIDWLLTTWTAGLRVGYTPILSTLHHHAEPPQYRVLRRRAQWDEYVKRKWGLASFLELGFVYD